MRGRSPGFRLNRFRPPSQGVTPQWYLDDRLPVTVAGAAAVSNRVPLNPLREPHAFSDANVPMARRQFQRSAAWDIGKYFVLSQVFENLRHMKGGFVTEDRFAGTICHISKFRQIARQNGRRSFRAWKSDGVDISIQPDRHLPIETLDRAEKHDYDVSKEHQECVP